MTRNAANGMAERAERTTARTLDLSAWRDGRQFTNHYGGHAGREGVVDALVLESFFCR